MGLADLARLLEGRVGVRTVFGANGNRRCCHIDAGIVRILEHMGLPSVARAVHPPRPPPQAELPFDASGFDPDPPAPDDFDA
jgi:hypothetical protein